MCGFTGINVNVVFKVLLLVICLTISSCTFAQAQENRQILLFIQPQCNWCQKALDNLNRFKKRNPNWIVKIYVMANMKEFMEFSRQQMNEWHEGFEYTLDFKSTLADTYGISQTPAYVIINRGKIKKVEGYVDLSRFAVDSRS